MTLSSFRRAVLAIGLTAVVSPALLADHPTARTAARMVFDEAARRIVLFGGISGSDSSNLRYELGDTWEWNGGRWIRRYPEIHPGNRSGFTMFYEPTRRRTVLFGGVHLTDLFADTWSYSNGVWQQLSPPTSPSARAFATSAFDRSNDRVLLYGGTTVTENFHDTWEFDGFDWHLLASGSPNLTAPLMVYDEARAEVLLLGWNDSLTSEMYRWEGDAWQRVTPETLPDCLRQGAITYQTHNQTVLVTGGGCKDGFATDSSWEWNGENWTKIELTFDRTPGAVSGHSMAYDRVRGEAILFGGDDFDVRNRTMRLREDGWFTIQDITSPGPRSLFLFAHDPSRGVSWLYGGRNEEGPLGDFWRFAGGSWQRIDHPDTPPGCNFPTGTFDTDRGRLVMLCEDTTIHEWDGESWFSFADLRTKPTSRRWASMVYDARLRKSVLFGGYTDSNLWHRETWLWDGASWTQAARSGTRPNARSNLGMFYDPTQQKTFIFGGIGRANENSKVERYSDMWSFDGTSWTQLTNLTTKPGGRYGVQIGYHPEQRKIVMFGGKDVNEQYINEQWEWNGTSWAQVSPPSRPSQRMNGALIYDTVTSRLTLFGGYAGFYFSELWRTDGVNWTLEPLRDGRRRATQRFDEPPAKTGAVERNVHATFPEHPVEGSAELPKRVPSFLDRE
ncbi:MAG TPA: hypothetical protein VMT00_05130 [Thermoanaerobaculia bacterium]|nr:hypothetical protein [Thermoanaerobaculia bacterium]